MAGGSSAQGWQVGEPSGGPSYGELGRGETENLLSKTLARPHLLGLGAPGDIFAFLGPQASTSDCYSDANRLSGQQ